MAERADVLIVGAGAAGLATAIFAASPVRGPNLSGPPRRVVLLDGAARPGAKILVSGGSRCNVTNRIVTERDFWGGRSTIVRRILRAFSPDQAVAWFGELGVPLHEEADGKLFPDSNRAREVLEALLRGVDRAGTELHAGHRVTAVERRDGRFDVITSRGTFETRAVVLATGGQSLPKSGSDGFGYGLARRLGHTIVPTTPALVPLVFGADRVRGSGTRVSPDDDADAWVRPDAVPFPSGVSHEAELAVWTDGRIAIRLRGALLWTHFGISGPVALNASRHWLRAELENRPVRLTVSFVPGEHFDTMDARLVDLSQRRRKLSIASALAEIVPASVAAVLLARCSVDGGRELGHLARDERRRVTAALVETPLPVRGCRGYNYAEVTAGGVALDEIDPATMQSRRCPGLYLVGEILDVDGRIGGFNFQWAWSSARVAGKHVRGSLNAEG